MRSFCRRTLALELALFTSAAWAQTARPVVPVNSGKLRGQVKGNVVKFLGVPFAVPPVGDLRWRPPQPAAAWKGIRDASDFGHECMQLPTAENTDPLRADVSEDCLFLNIWGAAGEGLLAKVPYECRFSELAAPLHTRYSGAPHSSENPYVFDTLSASKWGNFGKDLTGEDTRIAHLMNQYWMNFATTGDSNGTGLPRWPKFDLRDDFLLNVKETGPIAEPDRWKALLDLVERAH